MRIFLLLSLLIAGGIACSPPRALEYREFRNFRIESLGFSNSSVKMDMIYFNPNPFGLQLKRCDLDIYINDVYLGRTSQEYQVQIERKADVSIPIQLSVDMRNLFKNSLNVLFRNSVRLKVTGTVKIGKANVFMSFPVKYEEQQTFSLFQG